LNRTLRSAQRCGAHAPPAGHGAACRRHACYGRPRPLPAGSTSELRLRQGTKAQGRSSLGRLDRAGQRCHAMSGGSQGVPRHPWGRLPLLLAVLVKAIGSLLTSAAEPSAVYEAGRGRAGLWPRCHGAGVTAWQARIALLSLCCDCRGRWTEQRKHLSTMHSGHGCGDLCLIASVASSFRHKWLEFVEPCHAH